MKGVINLSNLYTIIGNEQIGIDKALNEIFNKYDSNSYDMITINMDESSLITLLNEINTIPFLTLYRMVVVKRPIFLYKNDIDERLIKDFKAFINNPLESTILIFIIDNEKEKSELVNFMISKTNVYDLTQRKIEDINTDVKKIIENDGYKISNATLDELLKRVNKDPERIIKEIEKLEIYKNDDKKIEDEDIDLMVYSDIDDNVFELTKDILSKNKLKALSKYNNLVSSGVNSLAIISSLLSSLYNILITKILVNSKYSKEEISKTLHVSSGRAYYLINDSKKISQESLEKIINDIVNLEYEYKIGRISNSLILEDYILSL